MRFFRHEPPIEPTREPTAFERQTALIARFDALCAAVSAKGAHFRRDFGHWVRLRLADGTHLELDSYGRNLMLKEGSGEYPGGDQGFFGGFTGRDLYKIGGHFGSPVVYVDDAKLAELEAAVAVASDQRAEGDPTLRSGA